MSGISIEAPRKFQTKDGLSSPMPRRMPALALAMAGSWAEVRSAKLDLLPRLPDDHKAFGTGSSHTQVARIKIKCGTEVFRRLIILTQCRKTPGKRP